MALCAAMAALPLGAWATVDFGTEQVVNSETTWLFNDYSTGDYYTDNTAWNVVNNLYARSIKDRGFTIKEVSTVSLTFSVGYTVNVSKVANSAKAYNNSGLSTKTAGATGDNNCTPFFAFNASVAGTCYVYVKGASDHKSRLYFTNGTKASYVEATGTDYEELIKTSTEAGTFFIGAVGGTIDRDIYAIRFVPTTVASVSRWIYIGATGYATFGNKGDYDIPTLPDGLKAYKAAAKTTYIQLTELNKMRRGSGYIVSGTANTNYQLTYSGSALSEDYKGGDMQAVTADMENFAPTNGETGDALRYRYILGADGTTAKFFTPSGSGTLKKYKAYLQTKNELTIPTNARGIDIVFDDSETTGISNIRRETINNNEYYNLAGQRVVQPTKGLYIVNGKKVIIK